MELTIILIIALLILSTVIIVYYFESKKPSFNCYHRYDTIKTRESVYCADYLSTCKLCGKQSSHKYVEIDH